MNHAALRYVVEASPSTGAAWQLLMVIAYRADRNTGECYASRRRLATEARISTSTIHQALEELLERGELEILVTGSGRRATTYRITGSGSVGEPNPDGVVARFEGRSGSVDPPVVARSPDGSIEGREEQEGFEGRAGGAAADAAAPRSNGQVPPDAAAAIAALKASSRRVPSVPLSQPDVGSVGSVGSGPDARPVSAAAADAQQAAPDPAATTHRRPARTARGRKGRRGREPPATRPPVHRSTSRSPPWPTTSAAGPSPAVPAVCSASRRSCQPTSTASGRRHAGSRSRSSRPRDLAHPCPRPRGAAHARP